MVSQYVGLLLAVTFSSTVGTVWWMLVLEVMMRPGPTSWDMAYEERRRDIPLLKFDFSSSGWREVLWTYITSRWDWYQWLFTMTVYAYKRSFSILVNGKHTILCNWWTFESILLLIGSKTGWGCCSSLTGILQNCKNHFCCIQLFGWDWDECFSGYFLCKKAQVNWEHQCFQF